VLAYLVDFLDAEGQPEYRVYYADSSSCSPCGYVNLEGDDHAVDVAVLTAGGFDTMRYRRQRSEGGHEERGYPEDLLDNLCARHVIVAHWESFFERYTVPSRLEPLPGVERIVSILKPRYPEACLPEPGARFWFAPAKGTCTWGHHGTARQCGCRLEGDGRCHPEQ
jgi:hypothetical protein